MRSKEHRRQEKLPTLSRAEALIMGLLLESPATELYGLELVRHSDKRLKRGTVYVTLGRMEDKGYVESREDAPQPNVPGLPRRLYKATGYGQRVYFLLQQAYDAKFALASEAGGVA